MFIDPKKKRQNKIFFSKYTTSFDSPWDKYIDNISNILYISLDYSVTKQALENCLQDFF